MMAIYFCFFNPIKKIGYGMMLDLKKFLDNLIS